MTYNPCRVDGVVEFIPVNEIFEFLLQSRYAQECQQELIWTLERRECSLVRQQRL